MFQSINNTSCIFDVNVDLQCLVLCCCLVNLLQEGTGWETMMVVLLVSSSMFRHLIFDMDFYTTTFLLQDIIKIKLSFS